MKIEKQEKALRLYEVFVHFMHMQFGGPKQQRTPSTNRLEEIESLMRDPCKGEQLAHVLMQEYLSNDRSEP